MSTTVSNSLIVTKFIEFLEERNIGWKSSNNIHFIIETFNGRYDVWPTTGRWSMKDNYGVTQADGKHLLGLISELRSIYPEPHREVDEQPKPDTVEIPKHLYKAVLACMQTFPKTDICIESFPDSYAIAKALAQLDK